MTLILMNEEEKSKLRDEQIARGQKADSYPRRRQRDALLPSASPSAGRLPRSPLFAICFGGG